VSAVFSRISRYRDLPDVAVPDATGRVVASRELRLPPVPEGRLLHTVEEGDRLDHLGYKYYKQPRDWWRIADANPAFLSPRALLGDDAHATLRVPLRWEGPFPPWSPLLRELRGTPGVDSVVAGAPGRPEPRVRVVEGPLAFGIAQALTAELDAAVRGQRLPDPLGTALAGQGAAVDGEVRAEKLDAATWRVTEVDTWRILAFRHFPEEGLLNVHLDVPRYDWAVTVGYNALVASAAQLLEVVEARGFAAGPEVEVGRVGKPIAIPARG
jgi:hypothetical protein